jgi:hypothetical protein
LDEAECDGGDAEHQEKARTTLNLGFSKSLATSYFL